MPTLCPKFCATDSFLKRKCSSTSFVDSLRIFSRISLSWASKVRNYEKGGQQTILVVHNPINISTQYYKIIAIIMSTIFSILMSLDDESKKYDNYLHVNENCYRIAPRLHQWKQGSVPKDNFPWPKLFHTSYPGSYDVVSLSLSTKILPSLLRLGFFRKLPSLGTPLVMSSLNSPSTPESIILFPDIYTKWIIISPSMSSFLSRNINSK